MGLILPDLRLTMRAAAVYSRDTSIFFLRASVRDARLGWGCGAQQRKSISQGL
ncbi:MAG: hypothetical protein ABSG62_16520 [Terracidiphilus sp.]